MSTRVLVAGMGNDLCRDDGFGITLARRLLQTCPPPGVHVVESGIGGVGLVQDLMDGYDALVVLDAADRGGKPGTLYLLETQVPTAAELSEDSKRAFLSDMHLTVPSRALTLAQALHVLPPRVYILGCQPAEVGLGLELSGPVERALDEALRLLHSVLAQLGVNRVPA